jgi:hypothetical protein
VSAARPIRIANVSGFFGDRIAAAREMLDGPEPVDVLTGDYLAELTMLILWKQQQKDPGAGYAGTFAHQMADVMADCLARGVKVVSNAGGLNPRGLRDRLLQIAAEQGLTPRVAVVEGDDLSDRLALLPADLLPTDLDGPIASANAYLGGHGIAAALEAGANIVVTGRVTDASLVVGHAMWWHGWTPDRLDALAGAVAAGHVIECGPQATGGNYPFLAELAPGLPGFPIAEVADDGSFVVTKQPGTGGAVTPGTVTAQLLYELGEPAYANPDVVAHFDTIELALDGPDRVRVSGTVGSPPPDTLKVAVNFPGGYRNTMTMVLTGLDIEAKAAHATAQLFEVLGGREQFDLVDVQLLRTDHSDAAHNPEATAQLRVTVKSDDATLVGRRFSNAVTELSLQSYAGFFTTTPPTEASAFGIYQPTFVPRAAVPELVVLPDATELVLRPLTIPSPPFPTLRRTRAHRALERRNFEGEGQGEVVRVALGTVCGARSGDKGGNANIGVWAVGTTVDDADAVYDWLDAFLTADRVRVLLGPEAAALEVRRYELPLLRALNFVVVGILGDGVASSVRYDPQAKGLGEFLRARVVDIPASLLG